MSDSEYNTLLEEFAYFVAGEIFDDEWEFNSTRAFSELACRKLSKLGIVEVREDSYCFPNLRTKEAEE